MIDILKYKNRLYYFYRRFLTLIFYKPFSLKIEKGVVIYPQTILSFLPGLEMKEYSILLPKSRIELIPKYAGVKFNPILRIGKESQIHQNCHLTCAGNITIGNNVIITSNVTITNIIHPHENDITNPINKNKINIKDVYIDDQVYIYNNAVILPGVHIGKHSIIGANSVVRGEIPPYSIAVGNPAKVIKRYNFESQIWEKI